MNNMQQRECDFLPAQNNHYEPQGFVQALKYGVSVALLAFGMQAANAAEITSIANNLTGEIEAGKAVIIGLFSAGAVLLGIFAGFRYLKRGAGSA